MPMISTKAFGSANSSLLKKRNPSPSIAKQMLFDSPGTYSWICPAGVTSVSVVAIGGGGGGGVVRLDAPTPYRSGGGGAGLAWINNYTVTPGSSYTVQVGEGGLRGYNSPDYLYDPVPSRNAAIGGNSYFISTSICNGWGGGIGSTNGTYKGGSYTVTTSTGSYGGGAGGESYSFSALGQDSIGGRYDVWGGGGAGGYTGVGGYGYNSFTNGYGAGTGGAGGGGGYVIPARYSGIPTTHGGGGGGVGVYGQGPSGGASIVTEWGIYTPFYISYGGGGGSGGQPGNNGYSISGTVSYGDGGRYGGGGATGYADGRGNFGGNGGVGAVRIMWGAGRAFPSTNTGDQFE